MNRILLMIGIVIGFFTLLFNAYVSYVFVDKLTFSAQQRNEKLSDMANFQEYLSMLKDAETGERGYVITGNPSYLEPYEKGLSYIHSKKTRDYLENSEKLEHMQDYIKQLKTLTTAKLDELQTVIDKYNSSGFQAAKEIVSTNSGKNSMDTIRDVIDRILIVKHNALEKHELENENYTKFIVNLIISINLLYLILISLCLYVLYMHTRNWRN